MKTYALTLTAPDGSVAWTREVDEKHVKMVAEFLQNNLGLILAARGVMDAAKGVEAIIQGLGSVDLGRKKKIRGRK